MVGALVLAASPQQPDAGSLTGVVRKAGGGALAGVVVRLKAVATDGVEFSGNTGNEGNFTLPGIPAGRYSASVEWEGRKMACATTVNIVAGRASTVSLGVTAAGELILEETAQREGSGGEVLSQREVSGLPLNKRDFSQLLLLAAGTMTDANGAANFTQQFAINGQRGTAAVFAMDGITISDAEMGGATFSNFNVDAVQEIRSSSGFMPAEIGGGAAGFTDIVTRSGGDRVHGSAFEFVRNAAFDARNFFDRRSLANPGRIPRFVRNEFGFTNGGPLVRGRTYYFGQYQGFRQVLGTTQMLSVPTAEERAGRNKTAFPGDTLLVPVAPAIKPLLARYPLPNDPQGPYGERTYATSSKVSTVTNQFSVRIDHTISDKSRLFGRFNLNNVTGPTTNPSQTAIDPGFAIRFLDRQRNFGLTYSRQPSPRLSWELSLGVNRSTPSFPTVNHTEPALKFADGLYEAFNAPAGSVVAAFGTLFQLRHNLTYTRAKHTLKMGVEVRANRDTTYYGTSPNGEYTFGGGTAYSPVDIRSLSGAHDIHAGDPLPDALSGLLTATPFSYSVAIAPPLFPQGARIGEAAIRRESYNFYFQDSWKMAPGLALNYGLRYEVNTRIREGKKRTSGPAFVDAGGAGGRPRGIFLINPDPPYAMDWGGWGPRLGLDWRIDSRTVLRAGAGLTTLLPNLWQDNMLTGGTPFVVYPYLSAAPGAPVRFSPTATRLELPPVYDTSGQLVFASGRSTDTQPNTEMDVQRFEQDLAALSPDGLIRPLAVAGISRDFRNGYIATYTVGLERTMAEWKTSASYVGTAGVKLPAADYPNSYGGADPAFAPYTRFDSLGRVAGGFGPVSTMSSRSHSTYHALQIAAQKDLGRAGLGFQASYTLSKSIDDTSAVMGGASGSAGAVVQTSPQNPWNAAAEKGPSTFDTTHVVAFSVVQELPVGRVSFLRPLGRAATSGWQLLNMTTLASGPPFSVYSGMQQTGAGSNGADRPDQIGRPVFSVDRAVREDYFGRGDDNPAFFSIPIGVPGGTGPNLGRFGSLGRNTFRGPGFRNFDFSLIKDTSVWSRRGSDRMTLQFRAEFFNLFNIVNFGLPANVVLGPGFGRISRTAGTSRQIQLSLKLIY